MILHVSLLRETGEKIVLPHPIRMPARSPKFAFAVTARVNALQNYFALSCTTIGTRICPVNMRSFDLDSWEVLKSNVQHATQLEINI